MENEQLSKTVYDKERERKRGKASQNRNRQSRMIYDLGDVAVCKTMFLQTLCVGEAFVRNALKKCDPQTGIVKNRKKTTTNKQKKPQKNPDQRGRKLNDDMKTLIKKHIKSFPVMESQLYEGPK